MRDGAELSGGFLVFSSHLHAIEQTTQEFHGVFHQDIEIQGG
jgi:hypothetical protein